MASAEQPTSLLGTLLSLQETGKRLVDAGELYDAFKWIFGCKSGITLPTVAPARVAFSNGINQIISGTFCLLPAALPGMRILVINQATGTLAVSAQAANPANNMQPDLINGSSTATQATGTTAQYISYAVGQWLQLTAPLPVGADEPPVDEPPEEC